MQTPWRTDYPEFDGPTWPKITETSMPQETMQWYPSKVDWWIALLLCVPPVASTATCIALALDAKMSELTWGLASVLVVCGVYLGLVFPLKYGLGETHLLVRFGVCRQRILLADILEVHPTCNPLSSPALSLDRLHIQFGKGLFNAVMISPADRDHFLDDLAQKAGMKREADRLVRV